MIFYGNEHIVIDFDGNEQILSKLRCKRWTGIAAQINNFWTPVPRITDRALELYLRSWLHVHLIIVTSFVK